MKWTAVLCLVVARGVIACDGASESAAAHEHADPNTTSHAFELDPSPAAPSADGWETIIAANWTLDPGQERYYCQRTTLAEDVYVSAIRAINPLGTHHTALTAASNNRTPDGLTPCSASGLEPQGIFGSGIGTETFVYPPGVGLRLRAGQQLLLNLHVFNTSRSPLRGLSGTAVKRTSPADIKYLAESVLAGPVGFVLPPGKRTTIAGQCTTSHDTTLFAVQPHMHQVGVHMKGVAYPSGRDPIVLHDGPFDFDRQVVYSTQPLQLKRGDVIKVECTFENDTSAPISFGESSNQEMCFLVLHRYPAAENPNVLCVQ